VAPRTPAHKGEVVFTSGLDASTFPPGIPGGPDRGLSHTTPGAVQETITGGTGGPISAVHLAYVDVVQWEPTP